MTHPVAEAAPVPTLRLQWDAHSSPVTYLLVVPDEQQRRKMTLNGMVYDPLVHAAWILAQRGHDSSCLSDRLGIPQGAARHVVRSARRQSTAPLMRDEEPPTRSGQ